MDIYELSESDIINGIFGAGIIKASIIIRHLFSFQFSCRG